jgi:hypothetical protein
LPWKETSVHSGASESHSHDNWIQILFGDRTKFESRVEAGCSKTRHLRGDTRVKLHPNAKLVPAARRLLVDRIRKQGWLVKEAAAAVGVSRRTAYKWLKRFDEAEEAGLGDRSSRPGRSAGSAPALRARTARSDAPRRCEEICPNRGHRTSRSWRPQSPAVRRGLGGGLRLRGRSHPPIAPLRYEPVRCGPGFANTITSVPIEPSA